MKKTLKKISYLALIALLIASCKKDKEEETPTPTPTPVVNTPFQATHMKFDGDNDFLNVAAPISGVTDFTFEAKFLTKSTDTGYRRLIGWGGYDLEIVDQNDQVKVYYNGTWRTTTGTGIRDNKWHHVAVTRDASNLNVYLDGAGIYQSSGAVTIDFDGLMAVGGKSSGGETWKGSIDEVRVWNVARTLTQIRTDINNELVGNETGLQLYYDFNQTSTDTLALDRTANEFNGDFGGPGSNGSSDPKFSKAIQNDITLPAI